MGIECGRLATYIPIENENLLFKSTEAMNFKQFTFHLQTYKEISVWDGFCKVVTEHLPGLV